MQITTKNIRAVFRQSGEALRYHFGARILKNWIHDNTYRCDHCEALFTDSDEVDDGTCTECAADWEGFDCHREWGTH